MGSIRVLLAVAVLVAHTNALFGLQFFGGGVVAVECFFVISGFYMALVLSSKYQRVSDFYFNRAVRIYPLYLVVLAAIALVAWLYWGMTGRWLGCLSLAGEASAWQGLVAVLANIGIIGSDYLHFVPFQSERMLSDLLAIPVVWSLAVELTFYAVAPFLNRCSTRTLCVIAAASIALRFALTRFHGGWTDWTYFFAPSQLFFFAIGMLAYRYYAARVRGKRLASRTIAALTAGWCVLASCYGNMGLTFEQRWVVEVPLMLLLPYIFELTRSSRVDRAVSAWSYPNYLVHSLVLTTYAPLRHFIPLEYYSLAALGLTLAGSAIAVRFDEWVDARLKRAPRPRTEPAEDAPGSSPLFSGQMTN
jgi:peptidoglycan/LPS O-acetylase OafA/YrhL